LSARRSAKSAYAQAAATCACNNLRRASRAVTQFFDQTLEPSGLRSTQLVILLEVAVAGSSTVPELARRLVMDRSTMQRNLQPLMKRQYLQVMPDDARRSRGVSLTPQGRRAIDAAVPLWRKAQVSFVLRLGEKRWRLLCEDLSAAVTAAKIDASQASRVALPPTRTRTAASRRTQRHRRAR
jgi:DNA-binding MarR family transcriptional regulator